MLYRPRVGTIDAMQVPRDNAGERDMAAWGRFVFWLGHGAWMITDDLGIDFQHPHKQHASPGDYVVKVGADNFLVYPEHVFIALFEKF